METQDKTVEESSMSDAEVDDFFGMDAEDSNDSVDAFSGAMQEADAPQPPKAPEAKQPAPKAPKATEPEEETEEEPETEEEEEPESDEPAPTETELALASILNKQAGAANASSQQSDPNDAVMQRLAALEAKLTSQSPATPPQSNSFNIEPPTFEFPDLSDDEIDKIGLTEFEPLKSWVKNTFESNMAKFQEHANAVNQIVVYQMMAEAAPRAMAAAKIYDAIPALEFHTDMVVKMVNEIQSRDATQPPSVVAAKAIKRLAPLLQKGEQVTSASSAKVDARTASKAPRQRATGARSASRQATSTKESLSPTDAALAEVAKVTKDNFDFEEF